MNNKSSFLQPVDIFLQKVWTFANSFSLLGSSLAAPFSALLGVRYSTCKKTASVSLILINRTLEKSGVHIIGEIPRGTIHPE